MYIFVYEVIYGKISRDHQEFEFEGIILGELFGVNMENSLSRKGILFLEVAN